MAKALCVGGRGYGRAAVYQGAPSATAGYTNGVVVASSMKPSRLRIGRLSGDASTWTYGRAHLFRDLAAFPDGTQFDIQFRVVDSVTQDVVLVTACHQFTVSP
jgi:hypothetical protein